MQGWSTLPVINDHDCDILVNKVRCKDLPDNDQGDFRYRRAVDLYSSFVTKLAQQLYLS